MSPCVTLSWPILRYLTLHFLWLVGRSNPIHAKKWMMSVKNEYERIKHTELTRLGVFPTSQPFPLGLFDLFASHQPLPSYPVLPLRGCWSVSSLPMRYHPSLAAVLLASRPPQALPSAPSAPLRCSQSPVSVDCRALTWHLNTIGKETQMAPSIDPW